LSTRRAKRRRRGGASNFFRRTKSVTQLTNVVFFRAQPNQTQALGTALTALVEPTRAETGCLNYDLHQSLDDTDVWFVYENWRSAEALSVHMQSEYLLAFLKAGPGLIAGDIGLRQFAMISKKSSPRA
jgi:quinol monooxygenase YgiN